MDAGFAPIRPDLLLGTEGRSFALLAAHRRGRPRPGREVVRVRCSFTGGLVSVDVVGAFLSVVGMGGLVVGVLVWQEGGESVAALLAVGAAAMAALVYWLRRRKREGKAALLDPALFASKPYRLGVSQIFLQQVALGGMLIA